MHTPKYAPILKWKTGERAALENLTENQKEAIIPVLEIVDYQQPTTIMQDLENSFGRPVYIDTIYIDEGDREYLIELLEAADNNDSVTFYPVLYYDDFPDLAERVSTLTDRIIVRLPVPRDFEGPEYSTMFATLVEWLQDRELLLDIMLDCNTIEDRGRANFLHLLLTDILTRQVTTSAKWQRVILAMTSFPESLSTISAGETMFFQRLDIRLFRRLFDELPSLRHLLVFADYGVTKFTESELDFSKTKYGPLPKARYTTRDHYWVLKGKKDRARNIWIRSRTDIAMEIYNSDHYYGEHFSFGDMEIMERARHLNGKGPGNNTNWVTIDANHHIVVVLEELASLGS